MFAPRAYILQRTPSKETLRLDEKEKEKEKENDNTNSIRARVEKYDRSRSTSPRLAARKSTAAAQEDQTTRTDIVEEQTSRPTTPVAKQPTQPVPAPSKPVVIPPRSPSLDPATGRRRKGRHIGQRARRVSDQRHDPRAMPPTVAALLAVTNIPPPNPSARHFRRSGGPQPFQKTSIDELIQGWREDDLPSLNSFEPGSPLDLLLESPGESSDPEDFSGTSPSLADESLLESHDAMSSRSSSSLSITSMPDLVSEDRSLPSWGSPTTPNLRSRVHKDSLSSSPSRVGKDKVVSSLPKQECLADHPLLPEPSQHELSPAAGSPDFNMSFVPRRHSKPAKASTRKSSLKSNLTASFNAIASSFRSFSNFTAPSIPPDDLLTRNMFPSSPAVLQQQRYVSEMRPKSSDGVPTAALRRYLNPNQHTRRLSLEDAALLSAQTLHPSPDFAAAATATGANLQLALELEGPLIPMQTYGPNGKVRRGGSTGRKAPVPSKASSSSQGRDPNSEAGRALVVDGVRQREPRENCDFLRVIVLEMNMRREGKLDARGVGRARVWLPPRREGPLGGGAGADARRKRGTSEAPPPPPRLVVSDMSEKGAEGASRKVPVRWVGVGVDAL